MVCRQNNNGRDFCFTPKSHLTTNGVAVLAEGVGFEPTVRLRAQRFSRPSPSSTRPSLRKTKILLGNYYIQRIEGSVYIVILSGSYPKGSVATLRLTSDSNELLYSLIVQIVATGCRVHGVHNMISESCRNGLLETESNFLKIKLFP